MAKQEIQKEKSEEGSQFAFHKHNYVLVIVGLVVMGIGFLLMIGGGTDNPNEFSDALFNFQRLTLAPILLLVGYIIEMVAILWRPKSH